MLEELFCCLDSSSPNTHISNFKKSVLCKDSSYLTGILGKYMEIHGNTSVTIYQESNFNHCNVRQLFRNDGRSFTDNSSI